MPSLLDPQAAAAARQQGLLGGQTLPPQQAAQAPAPRPQGGPPMNELFGLLAQHADNPTQVGLQYAQMQAQQQQANNPVEQMLRMYGSINPRDFDTNSMAAFHDKYSKTGQVDFGLLKRNEDLSNTEQKILTGAIDKATGAESDLGRSSDFIRRFEEQARQGVLGGSIPGGLPKFFKDTFGLQDNELRLLQVQFDEFKNKNAIASLPPGSASDADVKIAMQGWPKSTDNPAYIASYLRGMQKLRAIDLARSAHRASYLGSNRSEAGLYKDWVNKRDGLVAETYRGYGLRDAIPLENETAEQAAQRAWDTAFGQTQAPAAPAPAAPATPGATGDFGAPASPASGDMSDDDLINMYID